MEKDLWENLGKNSKICCVKSVKILVNEHSGSQQFGWVKNRTGYVCV